MNYLSNPILFFFISAEQRRKQTLDYLELYQEILTPAAAIDIELFHIPGEGLFAVFANSDSGGGRNRGVSGLYKWVEKNFRLYQRLPTVSAQSWCHFKIGNNVSTIFLYVLINFPLESLGFRICLI